ncbi:hypothetical protein AZE42_09485 [Rhizopogon vesiculosus]|uniref:Uncharacterized protein n=1 Tax=Rhizopogon vesiculosus TaxID=180088 RepID=A0A1J8R286_9AGAM|nr:hypothetical protein AZE42_09485 [Rhizopogon vesiculosus]
MNTRTRTRTRLDPFAPAHMSVNRCFCGKPTLEYHDFCFCSPECARADALRALGGDDCHYRKVVRKAYVNSGAPAPAIYRRKSEDQLRRFSIAKRISGIIPRLTRPSKPTHQLNNPTIGIQAEEYAQKDKAFPTLAQVTSAVLARKEKHGDDSIVVDTSTTNLATAEISLDVVPHPSDIPTQKTQSGFSRGARAQAFAPQQTVPLKVDKRIAALRRQSSILHPVTEEVGAENGDEAAIPRVLDHRTDDRPVLPRPQRHISPSSIHHSGNIRRSASFAGWHRPVERRDSVAEEGESLMHLFDQLSDARSWIEDFDGTPDQDEKSDVASLVHAARI